jgi:aspartate/methionine/tyrosine aminotransferase
MKEIASKALYEQSNQYPSLLGVPQLRQAVARHSEANQGLPCDWQTETLITVGATEGIASAFMGLINPGDEVGDEITPQLQMKTSYIPPPRLLTATLKERRAE